MTELRNHDDERLLAHVVEVFSRSLISSDVQVLDKVLSPEFDSRHPELRAGRDWFVGSICESGSVTRVLPGDGDWTLETDRASFGPVVVYVVSAIEPLAVQMRFRHTGGRWLIEALDAAAVPPSYLNALPENSMTYTRRFRLSDASGTPVAARVSIVDSGGQYWPPAGHAKMFRTGWNQDLGGDVLVRGRRFAYVDGEFSAMLPAGAYSVLAERGPEYTPASLEFVVEETDRSDVVKIELARWVNMRERGWFSGDTHVHMISPHGAMLEARGEDLDVVNILAAQWADYFTSVEDFVGSGPALTAAPSHVVSVSEESRHTHYGHTSLLRLSQLVWPMAWGQRSHGDEGVWGGHDWPSMSAVADRARDQDGLVVWAHIVEGEMDGELASAAALGKLDAVEVFHFTDPFYETTWQDSPQRPTTFPWYRLLNCGFDLPAVAGTDKMYNQQVIGAVRAYVHVTGEFSFEKWLASISEGRTFVTSGPVIDMSVNGRPVGARLDVSPTETVTVAARAQSQYPLDMLQIVRNGRVVAESVNPDGRLELAVEHSFESGTSSWVAARCYGRDGPLVQKVATLGAPGMPSAAHTSPSWLHVGNQPVRVVEDLSVCRERVVQLIEWLSNEGHFRTGHERDETLATATAALAEYDRLLQQGRNERT